MGNQYHQTLKFEKISGKSATFLFTLEINSTKREKTIPPLLLQRAPHIFCKDVRMSKFGAVTPNGKHSVFVIRICFSIVNVFSRCNGRGAGARYNRDWVQSNQTEIWTCFYQVFLIQLKRQFFSFFAIPIIEENMCSNTLHNVRPIHLEIIVVKKEYLEYEQRKLQISKELCCCLVFCDIESILRAVLIRISNRKQKQGSLSGMFCWNSFILNHLLENRNRNRFVPVTFECVTICDICDQNVTKSVLLKNPKNQERVSEVTKSKLWHFVTVTNVTNGHTLNVIGTTPVSISVWNPDQNDFDCPKRSTKIQWVNRI